MSPRPRLHRVVWNAIIGVLLALSSLSNAAKATGPSPCATSAFDICRGVSRLLPDGTEMTCNQRAQAWINALLENGYSPAQITTFTTGRSACVVDGAGHPWNLHTAPTVDGCVIDPAWYPSGPVDPKTWANKMGGQAVCHAPGNPYEKCAGTPSLPPECSDYATHSDFLKANEDILPSSPRPADRIAKAPSGTRCAPPPPKAQPPQTVCPGKGDCPSRIAEAEAAATAPLNPVAPPPEAVPPSRLSRISSASKSAAGDASKAFARFKGGGVLLGGQLTSLACQSAIAQYEQTFGGKQDAYLTDFVLPQCEELIQQADSMALGAAAPLADGYGPASYLWDNGGKSACTKVLKPFYRFVFDPLGYWYPNGYLPDAPGQ